MNKKLILVIFALIVVFVATIAFNINYSWYTYYDGSTIRTLKLFNIPLHKTLNGYVIKDINVTPNNEELVENYQYEYIIFTYNLDVEITNYYNKKDSIYEAFAGNANRNTLIGYMMDLNVDTNTLDNGTIIYNASSYKVIVCPESQSDNIIIAAPDFEYETSYCDPLLT